jgi:Tol biopolymer transport system component
MLTGDRWTRVRALLEEVVDRPADDRSSYLAEVCQDDPDVRQEVESLLRAQEAAGAFLEPAGAPSAAGEDAPWDRTPALEPGTRLGSFEIVSTLGAGGMGEVYRARDTRLDRHVAIKILSGDLSANAGYRERFEREARVISKLAHPHICVLYDVGHAAIAGDVDRPYLVMELVDGETLAARLRRGALPLDRAVTCAIQIAEALAAADAQGIIHRDLKPANIMIGAGGVVKVLDFGLARLMEADASSRRDDVGLSEPGRIAGTAAYMSPEQAAGGKVDARSDIFSFGAVLYEMATGARAFAGHSTVDIIAAVVQARPTPPTQIVASMPRALERLILRCLQREPERRNQTMLDVRNELMELDEELASRGVAAPTAAPLRRRARLVAAVVAIAAALALVAATWVLWPGSVQAPPMRVLPVAIRAGYEMMPALSPDGEQVAFAWNGDKGARNFDLHISIIGSPVVHRITSDPAHDVNPSWSPDGRRIAFVRHRSTDRAGHVYVISPLGGAETKLSDFGVPVADDPIFAPLGQISWSADGRYIAAGRAIAESGSSEGSGIYLIPTQGGEPRLLTRANAPGNHRDPAFSPDGRRLAYLVCTNAFRRAACEVVIIDLDGELRGAGPPRPLTSMAADMSGLAWTRDGQGLVFGSGRAPYLVYLWRVATDAQRPPERVELAGSGAGRPAIATSRDRLVFERRIIDPDIYRVGAVGPPRATIVSSFPDFNASFSPDGTRIVYASSRSGGMADIWVADADGSTPRQLTHDPSRLDAAPRWSPDGRAIAFASRGAAGESQIWTIEADGGNRRQITTGPGEKWYPSWSRDGAWIYFTRNEGAGPNIWRIAAAGGREMQLTRLGGDIGLESADGRSLVYKLGPDRSGTPLLTLSLTGGSGGRLRECVYGFSVGSKGVYYYPCRPDRFAWTMTQSDPLELRVIDPATGQDRLVGSVTGVADRFWGPVVSPHGAEFLFAKLASDVQDLMVIENFR